MRVFGQPDHTVFGGPVLTMTFAIGLLAWLLASPASADGSSPPPSGSPTPTPTPPPGLTTWQTAAPIPTPAPKSAAPATPIPSTSPSPSPSIDPAEARARAAALLANATSLAQIIDAQARGARDELAALDEQVTQAQLGRLRDRARVLAAAGARSDSEARAAQVAVLQALAQDAAAAQTSLAQLVASAMVRDGEATTAWSFPLRGPITQAFGPTALALEPARMYRGAYFEHFHDAIDIAAPLGSPVVAVADGQVTFVGHLPDGAMIVLIAHPGGFVSEYAHLDDTFVLPSVRAGQMVKAGQVIGFVGLTGITTGPHLHFAL